MTFDKVVALKNVRHIPELRNNLISVSLLTKMDLNIYILKKIVICKNKVYVGKTSFGRAYLSSI